MKTGIDNKLNSAIQAFLKCAAQKYDISSAKLFGSRARADARVDSDVDVAVFINGLPEDFMRTKMALADIAYDILLDYDVLIEAMPVWECELQHPENYSNPRLLANIDREGIRL